MHWRHALLIVAAAVFAGVLGLLANVALFGSGPLLRSELGQRWPVSAPSGLRIAEVGKPMAPIRLADLHGQAQVLPRPGRPLLINYWASWCEPCRREMPLLAAYARRGPGQGVDVVAIALDTREEAGAFLALHPVPFTTLVEAPNERDSSAQLGNREGVLPFSVLISADGRLLKRQFGAFVSPDELNAWAQPGR